MGDRVTVSRGERGARSERGVAILAVAVSIVFIAAITVEFDTNTNVDSIAAANATDDVRAHFLARSGINLGRLLIEVQVGVLDQFSPGATVKPGSRVPMDPRGLPAPRVAPRVQFLVLKTLSPTFSTTNHSVLRALLDSAG